MIKQIVRQKQNRKYHSVRLLDCINKVVVSPNYTGEFITKLMTYDVNPDTLLVKDWRTKQS